MVLYQVLVGLPSWCCCASRLLGPVVFLLFLLGHLSQVGLVLILHPGFLFSGLVERGTFHRVPSPLSSFGMWSPFRVISVFCHYWSPTKVAIGGVFLCVVASHFVVLSWFPYVLCQFVMAPRDWWQRFSLACHCSYLYPSSPGFLCCFARGLGCATLVLPMSAHTCCWAWGFLCFLAILRPPSGSGSTGSSGFSSPLGFPTFAMWSPLRGRGLFVLGRDEGLVSPFGSGPLVSS